jgi:hypothetical protein
MYNVNKPNIQNDKIVKKIKPIKRTQVKTVKSSKKGK